MGGVLAKQDTEKRLAYNIRRQNCKITKRLYKIIEDAYVNNYLSDYEYHATIGWYYGMKFRHASHEEEVFIDALDKINDLVCQTIRERYADATKDTPPTAQLLPFAPGPPTIRNLTDLDVSRFKKILDGSPYDRPK